MIAIASAVAIAPRVRASAGSNGRVARAIQTRAPSKITIGATERRTSVVAASGKGFFSEPTNDGATMFRFYDENDAAAKAAAKAAHEAATGKKDEPEPEPEKPKAAEAAKPKAVEASKPAATKEDKPAAKKEDKKATGAEDDALTSAMNDWIAALPEKAREKLVGDLSKCETEEEEWTVLVASAKADTTKVREKQREVLIAEAAKKGFK